MKNKFIHTFFFLFVLLQLICVLHVWQYKEAIEWFVPIVLCYSLMHILYVYNTTLHLKTILIYFSCFSLVFIISAPFLSDDLYRYLWDGYVINNGLNPYTYPPEHFFNSALANSFPYSDLINHPEYSTVYLPVNQILFGLFTMVYTDITLFKAQFFICMLPSMYFLYKIDTYHNCQLKLFAFVCLHPLFLYEVISSAHIDSFSLMFLLISYYYYLKKKETISAAYLAISACIKPVSLIILLTTKQYKLFLIIGLFSAFFLVYLATIDHSGFIAYSKHWHFGHPIFLPLHSFFPLIEKYSLKLVCFILSLALFLKPLLKHTELHLKIVYSLLLILFSSPVIYPWYFLPILPFIFLFKKPALLFLVYSLPLSYIVLIRYFSEQIWQESLVATILPYGIILLIFLYEKVKKPFNLSKIRIQNITHIQ